MELIENFRNLPDEIIHIIINYTDVIVYRYGKYINRLKKIMKGIIYLKGYLDPYILGNTKLNYD